MAHRLARGGGGRRRRLCGALARHHGFARVDALPLLHQQRAHGLAVGQAAQRGLRVAQVPGALVRPQVKPADAVLGVELQRDVQRTPTIAAQRSGGNALVGQVEGQGEHNAHPHHHPLAGQGVERGASGKPGHTGQHAQGQRGGQKAHRQRSPEIATGRAFAQQIGRLHRQHQAEVDADLAHMEGMQRQLAPVGRALPEHRLADRQRRGQAGRGLPLVLVGGLDVDRFHRMGSWRSGVAYRVPAP